MKTIGNAPVTRKPSKSAATPKASALTSEINGLTFQSGRAQGSGDPRTTKRIGNRSQPARNIVVVDDQAINRKVLSRLIATLGTDVRVIAFADPLEALDYIQENPPDLLITDYQMPSIDGAELIRRVRNFPNCVDVPAMVLTVQEDAQFRSRAFEAGANDFLLSPVDHELFRCRSRRLLALRRRITGGPLSGRVVNEREPGPETFELTDQQIALLDGLLQTVSRRLVVKILALDQAEADLQNLIDVSAIPAIFFDENLLVRRFTSTIAGLYRLTKQHIGRPLGNAECNLAYDSFQHDYRHVMETGKAKQRYLSHRFNTKHYLMRMLPNLGPNGSVIGGTMTFTKIGMWYGGKG